jgi:hypothetical protein
VGWTFVKQWAQKTMIGLETFCHDFLWIFFIIMFLEGGDEVQ